MYVLNVMEAENNNLPTRFTNLKLKIMDTTKINNIEFDGIDYKDAPDFCDAFIISADYNGKEMTYEQLNNINENSDFVHEELYNYLH